ACKEPAVVGLAIVEKEGYPDTFAFDPKSKYYDEKSKTDQPTWFMVDIKLEKKFDHPVTLSELRDQASLKEMILLQKGSRLSVQPVKKTEFDKIVKLAAKKSN
ncbi:EVE domain-containing protein, partial [Rubripirellula sp.]|nr:EVE domain-containing protein [Rubripirellula sp.]